MKKPIKEGLLIITLSVILTFILTAVLLVGYLNSAGLGDMAGAMGAMFAGSIATALAYSIIIWAGVFFMVTYFKPKWSTIKSVIVSYAVLAALNILMSREIGVAAFLVGLVMIFIAQAIVSKFKLVKKI
jgi:hypothetical protein